MSSDGEVADLLRDGEVADLLRDGEVADLLREVIVDSLDTIAGVLIESGDEVTAREAGERLRDPAVAHELNCALVARFDQVIKGLGCPDARRA